MKKHHFFPPWCVVQTLTRRTAGLAFAVVAVGAFAATATRDIVQPRVVSEPIWQYPAAAAAASIHQGETQVMLSIADDGTLTDFLLLGWTHPAFAQAIQEALPEYRFSPAVVRGERAPVRMLVTFSFEHSGSVVSMSGGETFANYITNLTSRQGMITWVCPGSLLDRPLAAAETPSPAYPQELLARGEAGEVTIDFFVDGEGRVRLPAAGVEVHPSFAREAVAALRQWRFEPPTRRGQSVIVHASQTFRFSRPAKGPGDKPATAAGAAGGPRA